MIFPFEVTFKKELKIKTETNGEDLLLFIKSEIHENIAPAIFKKPKMLKNQFAFKLNPWGAIRGSDFDGVSGGVFTIAEENSQLFLSYTYVAWSNLVVATAIFGIPLVILFFNNRARFEENESMIFIILIINVVVWLATLFKQNRIFRRLDRKLELG